MRILVFLSLLASFLMPIATQAQVTTTSSASASASASGGSAAATASAATQVLSTGLTQDGLTTHDDHGHKIWVDHWQDANHRIMRHDDDRDTVVVDTNQLPSQAITAIAFYGGNIYFICNSTLYSFDGQHHLRPLTNNVPLSPNLQTNRIVVNNNQIYIIDVDVQNSQPRPWYRGWWSQPSNVSCQQFDLTGYWDQNYGWNRFSPMRFQTDSPLTIPVSNDYWVDGTPQCQSQVYNAGYIPNYSYSNPASTAYGPIGPADCPYLDRLWDQENNSYSCGL